MKHCVLIISSIFSFFYINLAQTLSIDEGYGEDGKIFIDFSKASTSNRIKFGANQQVFIGTSFQEGYGAIKVDNQGKVDSSFGLNGKSIFGFSGFDVSGRGITVQSNDKLLITGFIKNSTGKISGAVMRFKSNGKIDTTFANNGKLLLNIDGGNLNTKFLATQSDGKIIVAGSVNYNSIPNDFVLFRLNTNGSLDESFGEKGSILTKTSGDDDRINFVDIEKDGKIVIGGYTQSEIGQHDFILLKYLSEGTLDKNFDD